MDILPRFGVSGKLSKEFIKKLTWGSTQEYADVRMAFNAVSHSGQEESG